MQISLPWTHHRVRTSLTAITAGLLALAIGAADATATETTSVHLRVEGRDGTLEPGRGYVAGTTRTRRAERPDCANRKGTERFDGTTPIGALGLARQHNRRLNPLRMQLTDFGWQLCQAGKGQRQKTFGTFPGDFGGWLYRVNNAPGFAAMDEMTLEAGDEVLVHYAIFPGVGSGTAPLNNGRELALRDVPSRAVPGESFSVRVIAFDEAGEPQPVSGGEGIEVRGGDAPVEPDANGIAQVTVGEPGRARLRAVHTGARAAAFGPEHDIASERVGVCVSHDQSECPTVRGTLIRGSNRDDHIRATPGDDVIRAGRGNDVIDLRPGGRNRVFCGRGRDRVIVNRGERSRNTLRGCQRVVIR